VKRLALLALLASSCVVAAPAPLPNPLRKTERPAVVIRKLVYVDEAAAVMPHCQPAQPPDADPPG
jgi:hypothetical protein